MPMPADRRESQYQVALDTRAIELARQALSVAEQARDDCKDDRQAIRDELRDIKIDTKSMHATNETKFTSIERAMWTAAGSMIVLLLGWVFYLVTHGGVHP